VRRAPSLRLAALTVAGIASVNVSSDATIRSSAARAGMVTGAPGIESVGPLAIGPGGVLFVGDSKSAAVFALAMPNERGRVRGTFGVDRLDARIAALLGTTTKEVVVRDMAADTAAGVVYLSVTRGRGPDAQPAIIRVTASGDVAAVRLDTMTFSKLELERAPSVDQAFTHPAWGSAKRRMFSVTDLAYLNGELFVTGVTNEEFASSFRRASFPFGRRSSVTRVSMYHAAHGMYETEAPVEKFIPMTVKGERLIIAGYACTPIAKFPMTGLAEGADLRGTTIIELGSGSRPDDLFTIDQGREQYLIIVTNRRGISRVRADDIGRARSITKPIADSGGAPFVRLSMQGIREVEPLSKDTFVALRVGADSSLSLRTMHAREFLGR
jgi:hypothetical protein